MSTQVVTVIQEKGGSGKTTCAQVLGSMMSKDGASVLYIDTDETGYLTHWAKKTPVKGQYLHIVDEAKIAGALAAVSDKGFDAIFVDTAGYRSAMSLHCVSVSDLILIPVKPEEISTLGAIRTYQYITGVLMDDLKRGADHVGFVLMDFNRSASITSTAFTTFKERGLPVFAQMGSSTGFKEMLSAGRIPEGVAMREAVSFMADLQSAGLLAYYNDDGNWSI